MALNRPTFDEGLREWRKVQKSDKAILLRFDPRKYENVHQANEAAHVPHCEMCGSRVGQRGFIRFNWPVGHAYFGQAFPCPRCNP